MSTNPSDDQVKLDQIIQHLFDAREEIEQFASDISTNNPEEVEVFQRLKDDFKEKVRELSSIVPADPTGDAARMAIQDLNESLSKEPVHDAITYSNQKQNILLALGKVERSGLHVDFHSARFQQDLEKFKLKLEILLLKFIIGKFKVHDAFREQLAHAQEMIGSLKEKVTGRKNAAHLVRAESKRIFIGLRKALKRLK